ncbi:MAG: RNA pseudouridine synthase [Candidatus Solibacter usitatus]|nr:RNA pseudouridine synthase [Candidatus Solibacter usitatus]
MPRTAWGWEVTAGELESWIIHKDNEILAVNKPPHVLCHPSKHGPWSSLIGACRELLGAERLHMPSRLDRETSGVVVLVRNAALASKLQNAMLRRRVRKVYHAILTGELESSITVEQPIGKHASSAILVRRGVNAEGQSAKTEFHPLTGIDGFTLARVIPHTGRLHQIRVHANWMGHSVVGDKIYGPDENHFLEFLRDGWTAHLEASLLLNHHALHASEWECDGYRFQAGPPEDWNSILPPATIRWRELL